MYIVDRIENGIIVCENDNGNILEITKENCIGDINEGDVIVKKGEKWIKDESKTADRKKYIEDITKDMWEN